MKKFAGLTTILLLASPAYAYVGCPDQEKLSDEVSNVINARDEHRESLNTPFQWNGWHIDVNIDERSYQGDETFILENMYYFQEDTEGQPAPVLGCKYQTADRRNHVAAYRGSVTCRNNWPWEVEAQNWKCAILGSQGHHMSCAMECDVERESMKR